MADVIDHQIYGDDLQLVDRIKRGISFSQGSDESRGIAGIGGGILKNVISGS